MATWQNNVVSAAAHCRLLPNPPLDAVCAFNAHDTDTLRRRERAQVLQLTAYAMPQHALAALAALT